MAIVNLRNYSILESDSGTQYAQFEVSLGAPATASTTIFYYAQDGTAGTDFDFYPDYGSLTFAVGEQTRIIQIPVYGDTLIEGNETFSLVVFAGANATLAGNAAALVATATIMDDDDGIADGIGGPGSFAQQLAGPPSASSTLPTLGVRDVSVFEQNSGSTDARFLVTLSRPATAPVTFRYHFQDVTGSSAVGDYYSDYGTVTIGAGQQSTWISTSVYGDNLVEGNEQFKLVLTDVSNAVFAGGAPALTATGTIIDDDAGAPTLAGGTGNFGTGLTSQPSASATLPTVSVRNTAIYEGNSGSEDARFLITLDRVATAQMTFGYYFQDGTASGASGDYYAHYGTVTLNPGDQSTWISTSIYGDTAIEGNQTYQLVLYGLSNGVFAGGAPSLVATGTIIDDDNGPPAATAGIGNFATGLSAQPSASATLPTISVRDVAIYEGNSGSEEARFLVTLDKVATANITLYYAFQDGSASGASGDYYDHYSTLTIQAGQQSTWISTSVYGDADIEGDQDFYLVLSAMTGAKFAYGAPALIAKGTIIDDDGGPPVRAGGLGAFAPGVQAPAASGSLPVVKFVSTSVNEGNTSTTQAYVHVLLSSPATTNITMNYTVQAGTATHNSDYYGTSGSFTISAGRQSGWLSFDVYGDNAIEGDESFTVIFSNVSGATIEGGGPSASATVLIRDNDGTGTAGSADTGPQFGRVWNGSQIGETLRGTNYADKMYGSGGNDTIYGFNGNDLLSGDAGADTLIGGLGNDTYVYDGTDILTEAANAGTDTVISSVGMALGANFEHLTLTGSAALNGTGNDAANVLTGNSGANILNGRGGIDTFRGGDGNDRYYVDAASETVTETNSVVATGGYDMVFSSVTYTLSSNLEVLVLTGTASINATGTATANFLYGNSGSNTLKGLGGNDRLNATTGNDFIYGGTGNDQLAGGGGADTFVFDTALSSTTNIDVITDFSGVDDIIRLENAIFTGLGAATGPLASNLFWASATGVAHDADDRIVYNTTSGALYYDSNGSSAGGYTAFVFLAGKPSISAADFVVI